MVFWVGKGIQKIISLMLSVPELHEMHLSSLIALFKVVNKKLFIDNSLTNRRMKLKFILWLLKMVLGLKH